MFVSPVGQTIAFCSFCGLSGTGSAPALTDDKKRSSVPQGRCQSGYLSQRIAQSSKSWPQSLPNAPTGDLQVARKAGL